MEFEETEDEGNSIYRRLRVKIDGANCLTFSVELHTASCKERFQTPGDGESCSLVYATCFYDFEQLMGAEIMTAENVNHVQVSCSPKTKVSHERNTCLKFKFITIYGTPITEAKS